MSLAPGTCLGPYKVLAQIGVGGMGEVYRATDTNLHRDVAIKVLPKQFAEQPDRVARFEREAQLLASLNHPHIAQIYGVEESGGVRALAMELVSGETLSQVLKGPDRPIVKESLTIARQIADALEAAHEKGIIHRDLKPGNVMIDADGQVKVLDFGLGKSIEREAANDTNSPTITAIAATAGVMIGTAAYMAPEQAKGRATDKRSDLWAFGCVLYELLTGKRAFEGEDLPDTLASIMRAEPDWSALPVDTPPPVRRLIEGCLQKDRKARISDVAAIRFALDEAGHTSASAALPVLAVAPALPPPRRPLVPIAAGALACVVVSAGIWIWRRPAIPVEARLEITTPTLSPENQSLAISPDGRQIVYVAPRDGQRMVIWLRSIDSTTARALSSTEGVGGWALPFWSPDSKSIGFVADQKLKRLDLASGTIQVLTDAATQGGSWSSANVILYRKVGIPELQRIGATGGDAVQVTMKINPGIGVYTFPEFLPDGTHFICYAKGASEVYGIYLGTLGSDTLTRLTEADAGGHYLAPGWLAYIQQGNLVARRLDIERSALIGEIVPIAQNVSENNGFPGFSTSANGTIIYRPAARTRRQFTWFDRAGKNLGTIGTIDDEIEMPVVSPDGRRVAFAKSGDVWVVDSLDHISRVTFTPTSVHPVWSPDGMRVGYIGVRKDRQLEELALVKSVDGTGSEEVLAKGPTPTGIYSMSDWSRDGNYILVDKGPGDIWVIPVGGGKKPYPFIDGTDALERVGRFSPDGKWVGYESSDKGVAQIYIRPFTGPGQFPISTGGGVQATWRNDGKELYWLAPDATLMSASITDTGQAIQPGKPVALFKTRIYLGGTFTARGGQYAVARDGRFLINTVVEDEASPPIVVIQNWRGK